jgi:ABC-2 type transport system permease protein
MIGFIFAAAILPIVTMTLATAAFGNELEDKTLSYLVLKPVSRLRLVVPKYAVTVLMAGPLLVVSGVIVAIIAYDADGRTVAALAVGIAVGVVTYSSIFMWLGLMTTKALGFALFYVFLWEALLTSFPLGLGILSVRSYTVSIMYGIDETNLAELDQFSIRLATAAVGAGIVTVLFFYLTVRRLRRMDVP